MTGARPIRVVVVDDAETLRTLLVRSLARDEMIDVVGEAGDGRHAIDLIDMLRPDVVLLDLSMPEVDGIDVLRAVGGQCNVVVFTGYGDDQIGQQCRDLGARGFVEKGAPIGDVLAAIVAAATR